MKTRLLMIPFFVLCFCGCAQLSKSDFVNVFGHPHIDHGDTIYYLGHFHTDPHAMKITLKNGVVTKQQIFKITTNDLWYYVPLLIEMLEYGKDNRSVRSYKWLTTTMRLNFPNGYGEFYMHPKVDGWTNTPFARNAKLDETTYSRWEHWWNTKGCIHFKRR
ncbi:MAG: hypothetical protein OXD54_06800 [Candidatus Poribacteria bacterium]|nr:hypothetical protein [Candidatus Poribacteria bacterium]